MEQQRYANTRSLYDKLLSTEKIMSPHVKKLNEIISKSNDEESASEMYSFNYFITEDDLKGLS